MSPFLSKKNSTSKLNMNRQKTILQKFSFSQWYSWTKRVFKELLPALKPGTKIKLAKLFERRTYFTVGEVLFMRRKKWFKTFLDTVSTVWSLIKKKKLFVAALWYILLLFQYFFTTINDHKKKSFFLRDFFSYRGSHCLLETSGSGLVIKRGVSSNAPSFIIFQPVSTGGKNWRK